MPNKEEEELKADLNDIINQLNSTELSVTKKSKDCFISIDVECAATGRGHFDKQPCRISMVDYDGKELFDVITRVPNMTDPSIEFTGLTAKEINDGEDLDKALMRLHAMLIKMQKEHENGVTIVGQAPQNDIVWVQLKKDEHYSNVIDLAQTFKTGKYYYSLRCVAYALLDEGNMRKDYHDSVEDARVSMKLFRKYQNGGYELMLAKNKLQRMGRRREFPNFRVECKYKKCTGMYDPRRCTCGQKTARGCDTPEKLYAVLATVKTVQKLNDVVCESKL